MKFTRTSAVLVLAAVFTLGGPMLSTGRPVASSAIQAQRTIPGPAPPEDSPELFSALEIRFPTEADDREQRDPNTFLKKFGPVVNYVSHPIRRKWVPYSQAEPFILQSAERLWRSGEFDSVWVDVTDWPYENGVAGKHVIFNFVESSQNQTVPSPGEYPVPAPGFENPPPGHHRLYPL